MSATRKWFFHGESIIGAAHIQVGADNEDAFFVHGDSNEGLCAVAVADGHGDERHARSAIGSRIAVEVASELLDELASELDPTWSPHRLQRHISHSLSKRILYTWNERVRKDAGHVDPDGSWDEMTIEYGTTLLLALVRDPFIVYWQIGDGDILALREDGHTQRIFSEADADTWGSRTNSLCQKDAWVQAKLHCENIDDVGTCMIFLCTDGVSDSLNEGNLLGLPRWYYEQIRGQGWNEVTARLKADLEYISKNGVGDDTTVAMAYRDVGPLSNAMDLHTEDLMERRELKTTEA